MEIKYLGTAAAEGWPAVFCTCEACKRARKLGGKNIRTRSQAVVDNTVLIDLPPDTYLHVLRKGMEIDTIESVLITHSHQDHFYPMELLMRGEPYAHRPGAPVLTVYGNDKVEAAYRLAMEMNDSPTLHAQLDFKRVRPFDPVGLPGGYVVTPLAANHAKDENCLVYLLEKDGKRLFYGHDSGNYPEETWDYLRGKMIGLASFDCTNIEAPDGNYHMGLPDNRHVKARMIREGCAGENTVFVINHFSHNGKLMHEEIVDCVREDGFVVAYDGMTVGF